MEDRFPTNYSILLCGPPGVGKFEYLVERIRDDLRKGERVVFVTLDLHPNEIRARAKALHLDLEPVEGKSFVFVDCYSATTSERPETTVGKKTFLVSSFSNLEGIGMAMSKAGQEISSSSTATARPRRSGPRRRSERRRSSSRASAISKASGWR